MNREVLTKALDKVVNARVAKIKDGLLADAMREISKKPDVHITNAVAPTPVENFIDVAPLSQIVGQTLQQMAQAIVGMQRQHDRDHAAAMDAMRELTLQLGELVTAIKEMPAPNVVVPEPAKPEPAPKREIVIERQGENKMTVREI